MVCDAVVLDYMIIFSVTNIFPVTCSWQFQNKSNQIKLAHGNIMTNILVYTQQHINILGTEKKRKYLYSSTGLRTTTCQLGAAVACADGCRGYQSGQ